MNSTRFDIHLPSLVACLSKGWNSILSCSTLESSWWPIVTLITLHGLMKEVFLHWHPDNLNVWILLYTLPEIRCSSENVHHVLCCIGSFQSTYPKVFFIRTPITNNLCIRWIANITKNLYRNKCHPQNDDMFFSPNYLCNEIGGSVAFMVNPNFLNIWSGEHQEMC